MTTDVEDSGIVVRVDLGQLLGGGELLLNGLVGQELDAVCVLLEKLRRLSEALGREKGQKRLTSTLP